MTLQKIPSNIIYYRRNETFTVKISHFLTDFKIFSKFFVFGTFYCTYNTVVLVFFVSHFVSFALEFFEHKGHKIFTKDKENVLL